MFTSYLTPLPCFMLTCSLSHLGVMLSFMPCLSFCSELYLFLCHVSWLVCIPFILTVPDFFSPVPPISISQALDMFCFSLSLHNFYDRKFSFPYFLSLFPLHQVSPSPAWLNLISSKSKPSPHTPSPVSDYRCDSVLSAQVMRGVYPG